MIVGLCRWSGVAQRVCSMTHLEATVKGFLCRPVLELVENVSKIKLYLEIMIRPLRLHLVFS